MENQISSSILNNNSLKNSLINKIKSTINDYQHKNLSLIYSIGLIILIIAIICFIKNLYGCIVILLLLSILFLQIKQIKNLNLSQIISYIRNKSNNKFIY